MGRCRTVSTGQRACCNTYSAVLPRSRCFKPVRPCVAITIRSHSCSCASQQITGPGGPACMTWLKGTLHLTASMRSRTAWFDGSCCPSWSQVAGRVNACAITSFASDFVANSSAYCNAAFEASEKSIGQIIRCVISIIPLEICDSRYTSWFKRCATSCFGVVVRQKAAIPATCLLKVCRPLY